MNFLITDLECTCCDDGSILRENSEIIEIGAVLVDNKLNILGEFCNFVRPTINPKLHQFCKDLTTIQQSDVDGADTLDIVLPRFHDWASSYGDYTFVSWGAFDFNHFKRECPLKNLENPIAEKEFINYKVRFAKIMGLKRKNGIGLRGALNSLGMEFDGTAHRGIDDAKNVLRIMKKSGI